MPEGAIQFTPREIAAYYAARAPRIRQTQTAQWRGPCRLHSGTRDSLSIDAATGRWFCHSQCNCGGDIFDFEEALTGCDFKHAKAEIFRLVGRPEGNHNGSARRIVDEYNYPDEHNTLLYQIVRREPKTFSARRPDGKGGWITGKGCMSGVRLVLFDLPSVIEASTVFVAEGEKDVNALNKLGVVATCNPFGAGKWREEYTHQLRGKDIYVIPDGDELGRKHAADVIASLGGSADAQLLELPNAKDAAEWIQRGGTLGQLHSLAQSADSAGTPDPEEDDRGEPHHVEVLVDDWPEPEPLDALPEVQPFDEDLLPEALRPMVLDIAERMQLPLDLPAVAVVAALSGAIGRRALIQPKDRDTSWTVTPNLWAALIAISGVGKSPLLNLCTRPLLEIEKMLRENHEAEVKQCAAAQEEHKLAMSVWESQCKEAIRKNSTRPPRPANPDEEPVPKRLTTNDSTYQKLHELMSQNPAGLMLIRDELTGWLSHLDREENCGERAFALTCWNGDTSITLDRIGRGSVHVPHCCLSTLGGITPDRLRSYLAQAPHTSVTSDGLLQRFGLAVWPEIAADWTYTDKLPNAEAQQKAISVFKRITALNLQKPKVYRFAPCAQELFVAWYSDLQRTIRSKTLPAAMQSHLSKYSKLMPALALQFELAEACASGVETDLVSLVHIQKAADWTPYLRSHAERIYSVELAPELQAAVLLGEKIKQHQADVDGVLEVRRVYRHHWQGLSSPETVKAACDVLVDAGWLREIGEPTGGRPANRYQVNPRVWR
jgi:putative DNA primase/helicase